MVSYTHNLPEVSPCLLIQKESGIIIFHLRFTSTAGQAPREAASWPFIKPEARAARGWARAPLGSASPGSRGVTWSLAPARISQPPQGPNPRVPRAPSDRSRSNWRECPLGVPGPSPGYLGAELRRGLSPQAPSLLVSALLPGLPLPPRTRVPASAAPSHGPSSRRPATRRTSLRLPRQVLAATRTK